MQNSFKSINTLYLALLGGQLLIALLISYMIYGERPEGGLNTLYVMVVAGFTIGSVVIGFYLYNQQLGEVSKLSGLEEKLTHFRNASIVRWALLEGAALVAVMIMFLEQNFLYLIFFLVTILAFWYARPTIETLRKEYRLSDEEVRLIRGSMS